MERKSLAIELKETAGDVQAIFSTFNVPDHDGDVTLSTAFEVGANVRMLPAHDWAHYAIGRGAIAVDNAKAVFDGHFNLNTTAGRDWYESIKDVADMQEWSYGFTVLDAEPGKFGDMPVRVLKKIQVHEVSPVTLGAGIGTGVLAIKERSEPDRIALPFGEHLDLVVSDVMGLVTRTQDRAAFRAKEGRRLSSDTRQQLDVLREALHSIGVDIEDLLREEAPPQDSLDPSDLKAMFERFETRYLPMVPA